MTAGDFNIHGLAIAIRETWLESEAVGRERAGPAHIPQESRDSQ